MNFCLNDGTPLPKEILSVFPPVEKPIISYLEDTTTQPASAFPPEREDTTAQPAPMFPEKREDITTQPVPTFPEEGGDITAQPAPAFPPEREDITTQPVVIASHAMEEGFSTKTAPISSANYSSTGNDTNVGKPEYTSNGYSEATVSRVCRICGRPCEPGMELCASCQDRIIEQDWREVTGNQKPTKKKRRSGILPIIIILFLILILIGAVAGYLAFSGKFPILKIFGKEAQIFEESGPSYGIIEAVERPDSEAEEPEVGGSVTETTEPEVGRRVPEPEEPEVGGRVPEPEEPEPTTDVTPVPEPVRSLSERVEDFIDNCADRAFQRKDLEGFNKDNYTLAINAIYAHAGRRFKESDERLRSYFGAKSWYYPTIDGDELYERMLNEYQVQNLYLLLSYGIDQGFRKASKADEQLSAFISGCASRNFTVGNLSELDDDMAYLARNAIYARSGWDFESGYLRGFFSRFSWYRPATLPPFFREDMLNDYQKHNRDVVNEYIWSKGYSSLTGETARYEQALLYA